MSKEILPSAMTKNTGPDLYFFFGRVATHDSGRVCQTVTLPGAITKNYIYIYILAGIACNNEMLAQDIDNIY